MVLGLQEGSILGTPCVVRRLRGTRDPGILLGTSVVTGDEPPSDWGGGGYADWGGGEEGGGVSTPRITGGGGRGRVFRLGGENIGDW